MKHVVDFMMNTDVIYDRDMDTMRISGAPGETEKKAWDIIRRLDIEPELLLGYRCRLRIRQPRLSTR